MAVLSQRTADTERGRVQTQDTILDATVNLLADGSSYADLTVGDIATAAGVSRPTFYAHFRDKRALVLALGDRFERAARAASADWMSLRDDDVRGTLEAVFGAFAEDRHTVRALSEAAGYDDVAAEFWRGFHERYIDAVTDRITAFDPTATPETTRATAFCLVWMTERSFSEHLQHPAVPDTALLDAVEALWLSQLPVRE